MSRSSEPLGSGDPGGPGDAGDSGDAGACPSDDELAAFAAGELVEPSAREVEAHLDECATCRRAASALAGAVATARKSAPALAATAAGSEAEPIDWVDLHFGLGLRFGRFTLTRPLGRGAMGEVWAARDPELDREVALKLLRLRREDLGEDPGARLRREAQAMARLSHPNVVAIYELGADREQVFCAMELVDGVTLRKWMAQPRGWREVLGVALAAGRGLAAAHRAGLVHRDIKPDNVLMARDGRTLVTDFGLAKLAAPSALDTDETTTQRRRLPSADPAPGDRRGWAPIAAASFESAVTEVPTPRDLTRTGVVVGTPAYMPPEQLEGGVVDAQSDQFSFCVTLYEALFGVRPFAGANLDELAAAARSGAPPPADRRRVPRRVVRCLLRGLSSARRDRWPSMQALLSELERARSAPRRRVMAAIAVVVLALAAAGAVWRSRLGDVSAAARAAAESRISQAWSPARRDAITRALRATGNAAAADVAASIARALDSYRDRWLTMRNDAWAATNLRGEQSRQILERRLACLDRLADELAALVAILETVEPAEVMRASTAVVALAPVSTCADLDRLMAAPPTPTSPAAVEATKELRVLEAMALAGRHAESLERARALVARAEALADPDVLARAVYNLGSAQHNAGQHEAAEASLRRALQEAADARDHHLVAETWIQLLTIIGTDLQRPAEALALTPAATAAVAQAGNIPLQRADLSTALGAIESALAHDVQARDHFYRALEQSVAAVGPEHPRVANAEANLGAVLSHIDALDEAARRLERAVTIMRNAYGELHPVVGKALANLVVVDAARYDWAAAEKHARAALAVDRRVLGERHVDTVRVRRHLSRALRKLGRLPEARAELEGAREALAGTLPPGHPQLALLDVSLGEMAEAEGNPAEAERIDRAALEILRAKLPTDHPQLAYAVAELARMVAYRSFRDSLPLYDEALTIHTSKSPHDTSHDGEMLGEIGRAALAAQEPERALVWFERMPEGARQQKELREKLLRAQRP